MGLITKPFSFTNGEGNNVDATQINSNYDTIYSLVNGNLEAVNMKDSIITLAKLAAEVKVIESVTHTPLTSNYTLTGSETTIFSQNINPSAQRYCLFLLHVMGDTQRTDVDGIIGMYIELYDGATLLNYSKELLWQPKNNFYQAVFSIHAFKQLASGAHTIYVKGAYLSGNGKIYGNAAGTYTYLTTIVFAF